MASDGKSFPASSLSRVKGNRFFGTGSAAAQPPSSNPSAPADPSQTTLHPLLAPTTTRDEAQVLLGDLDGNTTAKDGNPGASDAGSAIQQIPYLPRRRTPGGSITAMPTTTSTPPVTTLTAPPVPAISTPSPSTPLTSAPANPALSTSTLGPPTTTTLSHSSSSSSLTGRLKLTNLKASAQSDLGLDNESAGMRMLEVLVQKASAGAGASGAGSSSTVASWDSVIDAIINSKATLLLPLSPLPGSVEITPQFLWDHLVYTSATPSISKAAVPVVASFGALGWIENGELIFETVLPPVENTWTKSMKDLVTRSLTLSAFHRSSIPPITASQPHPYPKFTGLKYSSSLPFPPPPKPTPSASRPRSISSLPQMPAGISNPFSNLFGRASVPAKVTSSPKTPKTELEGVMNSPTLGSPAASLMEKTASAQSNATDDEDRPERPGGESNTQMVKEEILLSAWVVDRLLKKTDLEKQLGKAIKDDVKARLDGLPSSIVDKVVKFVSQISPPPASSKSKGGGLLSSASAHLQPPPCMDFSDPEAVAKTVQDFLSEVHDELVVHYTKEDTEAEGRDDRVSKLAVKFTDRIEEAVCGVWYHLLFSPPDSDDEKHDTALSSRIAALNMLDLSLDHLGVQTDGGKSEEVRKGLAEIVTKVGNEFQKLQDPRFYSPKNKSEILVKAHKIVIEGLRGLPPIRLRPEGEEFKATPSSDTASVPSNTSSIVEEPEPPQLEERNCIKNETCSPPPLPLRPSKLDNELALDLKGEVTPKGDSTSADPADPPQLELPHSAVRSAPAESEPAVETVTESDQSSSGSSGADLLLPIIIFSVVKSNPSQLVSHLLFIQRYRASMCFSGEASYALVNVTAVVEFLEHVDLAELGLEGGGRILSNELSPLLNRDKDVPTSSGTLRIRGRVSQVGELASSGLTTAVDTGFGALRSLLGHAAILPIPVIGGGAGSETDAALSSSLATMIRPGQIRRASQFSIASLTASVAGMGSKERIAKVTTSDAPGGPNQWGAKREMVDIPSRPASIRESGTEYNETDEEEEGEGVEGEEEKGVDSRSVRSIASVRSGKVPDDLGLGSPKTNTEPRIPISERFARLASGSGLPDSHKAADPSSSPVSSSNTALPKASPFLPSTRESRSASQSSHSRRTSLLNGTPLQIPSPTTAHYSPSLKSPTPSLAPSIMSANSVPLPVFANVASAADLKISDIEKLLKDYKRLASVLRELGVWDNQQQQA